MRNYFHSLNEEEPVYWSPELTLPIAILDMNNGHRNIGIRNIKRLIDHLQHAIRSSHPDVRFKVDQFHVRDRMEVPDLSYDIYLSSGGPGDPMEAGEWEGAFFRLLDGVWEHNLQSPQKKFFFGICHSFQLMAKRYEVGNISARMERNLGIVPIFKTKAGQTDPLYDGLHDKFYAFDNRDYQVTDPDHGRLRSLGAEVLSYECVQERIGDALTGIRYTSEMEAVQFHPEAEKHGILMRFTDPEEKEKTIALLGEARYVEFMESVQNPNRLLRTYRAVLPGFLMRSFNRLMESYGRPPMENQLPS